MKEISLSNREVLIVLSALDDLEQELSDRGLPYHLAQASKLYARFDKLRVDASG